MSAGRTTRAERMAMPLARHVVRDLAVEHGACLRPVQLRRTDLATGQIEPVLVPCGHTLASVCPSCAERARILRAAQCREGWHLDAEPVIEPDPATDDQQWWVEKRADAQSTATAAETADTSELDELIAELDEEITEAGCAARCSPPGRGGTAPPGGGRTPPPAAPGGQPRTVGKTYTAPDGKTFRPSLFVTLTCPSYGRVDEDGAPVDPDTYDYTARRPRRAALRRAVRPVHPEPAPLHSATTCSTSPPSNRSGGSPRTSTSRSAAPSPAPSCARSSPPPTTRSGGHPPRPSRYDGDQLPVWDEHTGTYLDPDTGEVLPTWDQALDAIGDEDEPLHVARFGDRFDAQGVLAGSKDASRCIGYLTKYLTKHVADCHQAATDAQARPRRTARRRAAVRAVLADLRELAPLRHPAQERPARPAARALQGQGSPPRIPRLRRAPGPGLPQVVRQDPGRPPRRPADLADQRRSGFRQPTRPGTPGNPSSPATRTTCPTAQRLLHVVADRVRWQAALDEARRRAEGGEIFRQPGGQRDDQNPKAADPSVRMLRLAHGARPRRQMSKGMTLAELLALPLMVDVSTAARALGLSRSTATNSPGAVSSRAACCTSAAPTASLPPNCCASSESISVSYRRGFRPPNDNCQEGRGSG